MKNGLKNFKEINPNVIKYAVLRFLVTGAIQMLTVCVGFELWEITKSTTWLAMSGLILFLPKVVFILPTGMVADKFDRRRIISVTQTIIFISALLLGISSYGNWLTPALCLVLIFCYGTAFAFEAPAMTALLPVLTSRKTLAQAQATVSSLTQLATIIFPAIAGFLYVFGPQVVYWTISVFNIICVILSFLIKIPIKEKDGLIIDKYGQKVKLEPSEEVKARLESPLAGFRYIWHHKGILGAISLDMFAVLFGGVTALLPVYATDVLHVGAQGLGFLRAAPAIGAVVTAVFLVSHPLRKKTGKILFCMVGIYGIMTLIFAMSNIFAISMVALIILGAADQFSVVIRQTYTQLKTPDEVRGRVSAVNTVFIGASNQLGEFESGMVATGFSSLGGFAVGAIPAAFVGGCCTLVVTALWYRLFPDLRNLESLK
ncbi:MAG: MFS transporter [Candidatus Ancillula sp.]|jgi:MFS family permease|nr:MFS transporter [Candidatus Ancillula sp.]